MEGQSDRLTASAIGAYVYCEMKYHYSVSPPEDYREPEYVSLRKGAGLVYHSSMEAVARRRHSGRRLLLILCSAAALLVAIIWFL
jgi:hypothetical protein